MFEGTLTMALDLEKVLNNSKKTHTFDVKIATPMDSGEPDFKWVDEILEGKGMVNRTKVQKLAINALPLCFRHLQDFVGNTYQCEMTFEYPITSQEIRNEISTVMQINFNYIRVTPVQHPFLKDENAYYKYNDEDMMADAIATARDGAMADGINFDSNYQKELIDALSSKKVRDLFLRAQEVDMKKVEKVFMKGDNK